MWVKLYECVEMGSVENEARSMAHNPVSAINELRNFRVNHLIFPLLCLLIRKEYW